MNYNIIHILGQSNIDGRNAYNSVPSDLLAQGKSWINWIPTRIIPNIKVAWRTDAGEISIHDYNLADYGDEKIGNNWARENVEASTPENKFSFVHVTLAKLALTIQNILVCQVTSGGSRLAAVGTVDINGSWSTDYANITPGTPKLTEAWEIRRQDLLDYLTGNGDTYTELMAFYHQGENDAPTPFNYEANMLALFDTLRQGNPNMPIYYRTMPRESSGYNWYVRQAHLAVAAANPLNVVVDISNYNYYNVNDPVHLDARTQIINGEEIANRILGIEETVSISIPTEKSKTVDLFEKFLEIGDFNPTEESALRYLHDELDNEGLLELIGPGFYPLAGSSANQHKLNMLNPYLYPLSFRDCTHDTTGVQLNGISSIIHTAKDGASQGLGINPTVWGVSNDYAFDFYSRTSAFADNANTIDYYVDEQFPGQSKIRFFANSDEATDNLDGIRVDLVTAPPESTDITLKTNPSAQANTLGLYSCQFGATLDLYKDGDLEVTVAWNHDINFNASALLGEDGATRYSAKEYALFVPRRNWFTANQMATYYNIIQTYQAMLGREVSTTHVAPTYNELIAYANANAITLPGSTFLGKLSTFMANTQAIRNKLNRGALLKNDGTASAFSLLDICTDLTIPFTVPNGSTFGAGGHSLNGTTQYVDPEFNPYFDGKGLYRRYSASRIVGHGAITAGTILDGAMTQTNRNNLNNSTSSNFRFNSFTTGLTGGSVNMSGGSFKAFIRDDISNVRLYNESTRSDRTCQATNILNDKQAVGRNGTDYLNGILEYYFIGGRLTDSEVLALRTELIALYTL